MNIAERFRQGWKAAPSAPAFISHVGEIFTYGALDVLAAQFAHALVTRGVAAGDRVVVQVDKSIANVALYLGVLRMGGVYVPLNTAYTTQEVAYFISDSAPKLVVCRPGDVEALAPIAQASGTELTSLSRDQEDGLLGDALAHAPMLHVASRGSDDLAAIVYTSGTTGRSKGAMLTHGNLLDNAEKLHAHWGFERSDVLLHALPIFHVHGLFIALHTSFLNVTPIIFLETFDAATVRRHLRAATIFMGVPTYYSRLASLDGFGADECAGVRVFICGSAPLTQRESDSWTALTGHRILERYGMSEAGVIASNPLHGDRVAGSVGFALSGYAVRIANEEGKEVPRGEVGVIEIKGPSLFQGYWRMPEKTAEAFRSDGFFCTGDTGFMDELGRVSIVGRTKDLIISGGYNIYPMEIEAVLDAIDGVLESAVVGVAHPSMGEGVVAALVAKSHPVADGVVQAALDASLARFKHPRRFVWLDALPRNAMGKVEKAALRVRFREIYQSAPP